MSNLKINWQIKTCNVTDLKEYFKNPRKLTEKGMKDLEKSIAKFGVAEPLVLNQDMTIIGGHGRKKIFEKLGLKKVDCYFPDRQLTQKEVEELNIRLNKNIAGEFDFDILANEFEIDELKDWGFEEFELGVGDSFNPVTNDVELDKKTLIKCPNCSHEFEN